MFLLAAVVILGAVPNPGMAVELGAGPPEAPGRTPPPQAVQEPATGADPTGAYRSVGDERVTVHYQGDDPTRATNVYRFLSGQGPLPAIPVSFPAGVQVYLAPTQDAFDALTGGAVPDWGAGVALPGTTRIVMPVFEGRSGSGWSEARVLRHEWAHIGLHQYLEGLRIPRWFNEGYAEYASGGWDSAEGWRLRVALVGSQAPALDSLTLAWPRGRAEAQIAYMLAGTAVEYLVRGSGERGLATFLRRWREEERSFEATFRAVYGVTTAQFEEDWREYVKSRYGWLFVLSHSAVFWAFLSVLLLVMFWIRRRRDREAMARLRATDPRPRPAWWEEGSGDVDDGREWKRWQAKEIEEPPTRRRGPTE